MKSKPPIFVLILFVITFIWPFGLLCFRPDFHFLNLLTFFKEFSIPIWVLLFSVAWLMFRYEMAKNRHFTKLIEMAPPANAILTVVERERRMEILRGLKKFNDAENSIKSMEIVIGVAGVFTGIIGILTYFCS